MLLCCKTVYIAHFLFKKFIQHEYVIKEHISNINIDFIQVKSKHDLIWHIRNLHDQICKWENIESLTYTSKQTVCIIIYFSFYFASYLYISNCDWLEWMRFQNWLKCVKWLGQTVKAEASYAVFSHRNECGWPNKTNKERN